MAQDDPLIEVSLGHILLTMAPLVGVALLSWHLELGLESSILTGLTRAFVQLSVLSFILQPIFSWGVRLWWVVLGYVLVMVLLAAFESTNRSKYFFDGMFWSVLVVMLANVCWVSIFAFAIILQPTPVWDPQYVIPIAGMLLGNCINGVSLSLNAMLTSMVESSREIELLLSFGATSYEASFRLLKEAARSGTIPQLNGMAIIGLIAIPGMMTGQILGGSSVTDAARYQILITYLIAASSFGTVFSQLFFSLLVCFDGRMILRTDRLRKREIKSNALTLLSGMCHSIVTCCRQSSKKLRRMSSNFALLNEEAKYLAPQGEMKVFIPSIKGGNSKNDNGNHESTLVVSELTYSFDTMANQISSSQKLAGALEEGENGAAESGRRVLFKDFSLRLIPGGMALVDGPSGIGKSTLLRILAGLTPADKGIIQLSGRQMATFRNMSWWRSRVMYVPQTKVDIPGTPIDLMKRISTFRVRVGHDSPTTPSELKATTLKLVSDWGMNLAQLESEWKTLSGGESQRLLLALALASRPRVILLDESTSAMDSRSKVKVETSVREICLETGMCAVWITHDQTQKERLFKATLSLNGKH